MPLYQIHGYGRDTGRRRNRTYEAVSEVHAIELASADGTITELVTLLPDVPPEPATDRQKSYAHSLGIDFPPGISKEAISHLIDQAVNADADCAELLRKLAGKHRTAQITYWKPNEAEAQTRIVEPYEMVRASTPSGEEREYIRCWQIWPPSEDGTYWRTFRPDRIKSVRDGGAEFTPRQPVTLHTSARPRLYHFREDDPKISGKGAGCLGILLVVMIAGALIVAAALERLC
jgi:hypothetical protein